MSRAKNTTLCSLCKREIGVSRNWNVAPDVPFEQREWRVGRHAPESRRGVDYRAGTRTRLPICNGTGVLVAADDIRERATI